MLNLATVGKEVPPSRSSVLASAIYVAVKCALTSPIKNQTLFNMI